MSEDKEFLEEVTLALKFTSAAQGPSVPDIVARELKAYRGYVERLMILVGGTGIPKTSMNYCEHGDHPAPDGQRFCSKECQRCDSTPSERDPCFGFCLICPVCGCSVEHASEICARCKRKPRRFDIVLVGHTYNTGGDNRNSPHDGVASCRPLATGVVFSDGTAVMRWLGKDPSTIVWDSLAALRRVHHVPEYDPKVGHTRDTRALFWIDEGQE